MGTPLTKELLAQLGLQNARLGAPIELPLDESLVGEGKGAGTAIVFALFSLLKLDYHSVRMSVLESIGFNVERHETVLKVTHRDDDAKVSVHALQPGENYLRDQDDPGTLFLDLSRRGGWVIYDENGRGFYLDDTSSRPTISPIRGKVLEPNALSPIAAPVMKWCADAHADPWLTSLVEQKLAQDDPWQTAAAAAVFDRFYEFSDTAEARTAMQKLLAGQVVERLAWPSQWVRQLSADERRTIEELAVAEVGLLLGGLEVLEGRLSPDDSTWRGELLDLLHERDDLEAVAVLLSEASAGQRLTSVLPPLDEAGQSFLAALPWRPHFDDERLQRVLMRDPAAWWAVPAAGA